MPFTLTMPKMSPTMEEGTLAKWHKKEGDFVKADELLLEVATDKATVEYNALDTGFLRKILINEGQEAVVNQPIAIFTETAEEDIKDYKPEGALAKKGSVETAIPAAAPTIAEKVPAASKNSAGRILASPLAKKLAVQQGLDLSGIQGTGPRGRIMKRDLANALPAAKGKKDKKPYLDAGTFEEEPLSHIRKVISQRLQEAKMTIPHFYTSLDIDARPLMDIREQLKAHDIRVSVNDLIVKAAALALQSHPNVNSGFNADNNTIIRFKTIDISIAVSIPDGLITPIVRHADFMTIQEIAGEIRILVEKAKSGKLAPHEFQGGSFTISNLGMYGVSQFAAIINPPQAAILAVSAVQDRPIVEGDSIIPGKVLNLTLSSDHRVVDGVAAAKFLATLKRLLEAPAYLLI